MERRIRTGAAGGLLLVLVAACGGAEGADPEPDHSAEAPAGEESEPGPGAPSLDRARTLTTPRAELGCDFGAVPSGEPRSRVLPFRWAGEEDLVPGAPRTSCGCLRAALVTGPPDGEPALHRPGQPIPPGHLLALRIDLDTTGVHGSLEKAVHLPVESPPGLLRIVVRAQVE